MFLIYTHPHLRHHQHKHSPMVSTRQHHHLQQQGILLMWVRY
jgi:hypothetical protein